MERVIIEKGRERDKRDIEKRLKRGVHKGEEIRKGIDRERKR